jgi:5-methylcytosine-specific restriction endonuclease McrA
MSKALTGKQLTKALDQVIRDIFKAKYGPSPTCFVCGRKDGWFHPQKCKYGIQVGHYISRKRTVVRWDLDNLLPQCSHCNITHNQNPAPFTSAIIREYGIERIESLERKAKDGNGKKIVNSQKREWLKSLQDHLSELTSGS